MEGYEHIAIEAMHDHLVAALATHLGLAATARGLTTPPMPLDFVRGLTPGDNRTPLIMIWDEETRPLEAGHRNFLAVVDLSVAISFAYSTLVEEGEARARVYVEGIRRAVRSDPTLGGRVGQAVWTEASRAVPFDDDSMVRHVRVLGFDVHVHDEGP